MIAGLIIEHYLTWFPEIRSFYFAMFEPFMRPGNSEGPYDPIEFFPSHPMFEVKVPQLYSGINLCQYLEDKFNEYRENTQKKRGGIYHSGDGYIEEESFGFVSKVKLKGGKKLWLKLIDFNCSISKRNLKKVELALKLLKTGPGLIVNSGNSYHFYGEEPFKDHKDWRNFYRSGRDYILKDFEIKPWPKSVVRVIGRHWPRLTLAQKFGMLRVNQCSVKPLDPKMEKYFLGGELDVRPLPGAPCYSRFGVEYKKAITRLNSTPLTDEDRQELEDNWPEFRERIYCELPCEYQGKFLSCPRTVA